jgi:hypothetical protein
MGARISLNLQGGLLAGLAIAAVLSNSAIATILTFDVQGASVNTFMPQTYGDRASSTSVVAGGQTMGLAQGNGWTPNVVVSYAATFTGTPSANDAAQNGVRLWRDSEWQGVMYTRSVGTQTAFYDVTFTPDAGYGVRVNSFVADDYNGFQSGHTIRWWLYAGNVGGTLLAGGPTSIAIAANTQQTLSVPSYPAFFGPVVLRIEHVSGAGNDLAFDNINFDQFIPTPGAASAGVLALGLLARRRQR